MSQTRVRWLVRRLRAMPPGEIVARSRRTARHRLDDALRRIAPATWRRGWEPKLYAEPPHDRRTPGGLLTRERAAGLMTLAPAEPDRIVARADRFLRGEIQFFGYPSVQLPLPIDYWFDPHAGARWPDRHGKQIDYRHMQSGDPKWIWELNRCQELPILVQAWLLTGRESYAVAARDEALRWAQQNQPGRGVAWVNGYEAGLRAISLSMTYAALRYGKAPMSAAQHAGFLRLLWQHGRWIRRDPSTHSSANNHRIGELVGLLVLAALVPELEQGSGWFRDALGELAREASQQILPDGMGAERAFSYHLYVLDLLLVAVATLDVTENVIPQALIDALDRSGDALWAQVGSNEPALTYGDTDDGVALRLDASELTNARAMAAAIAARVPHPRARAVAGSYPASAWWLFGAEGRTRFEQTKPAADPGDVHLPAGGLVVLRRGRARVTMDIGSLGYLSLAAHAHADALSLTLTIGGIDLIVDPGTGSYHRSPEVREAFRGTGFHATVEVDGASQSESGGPFLWSRHAQVRDVKVDLSEGSVAASHDGYLQLTDPVAHRRCILAVREDALLVVDRLEAVELHHYRQLWPFHRDVDVERQGATRLLATGAGAAMRVCAVSSVGGDLELVRGRRKPFAGWWSRRLESWEPAYVGAFTASAPGVVHIAALLAWADAPPCVPRYEVEIEDETVVVIVDSERTEVPLSGGRTRGGARRRVQGE